MIYHYCIIIMYMIVCMHLHLTIYKTCNVREYIACFDDDDDVSTSSIMIDENK